MMEPKSYFFSKKSFNEIGLSGTMTGVLNYLRLEKPSKIQALSFNTILSGKHCIGSILEFVSFLCEYFEI